MKRIFLVFTFLLNLTAFSFSQKIDGKLKFEQAQHIEINMVVNSIISQQAMGQSIDFNVDATGIHSYKVTNATEDNTTLHHKVDRIKFKFDGMGNKRTFDSNDEKDMKGQMGKPIKEIKDKTYDMVINPTGKVLMAFPEKIITSESDSRLALITNMMKEVLDIVQPPAKDNGSFFSVLPDKELTIGDTWTESIQQAAGKASTTYTIAAISDTTIIIEFTGTAITVTKAEMMGNETTTTMNNKSTGNIILDRKTNIIKEKTINMEGTGNTETTFGTLPVTSKTKTVITVKPD